jgi:glucose/arabinose dehydrogenase
MKLTELASGLASPTFLAPLPDAGVLLVLEQSGRVRKIVDGVLDDEPFLDLTDRIRAGGERGLALHPSFSSNGLFYLHYSARGEPSAGIELGAGVVSEFVRRAGALAVDAGSERRQRTRRGGIWRPCRQHDGRRA